LCFRLKGKYAYRTNQDSLALVPKSKMIASMLIIPLNNKELLPEVVKQKLGM
jgi:hypothetical protein